MTMEALEAYKGLVYRLAQSFGIADQDDILSAGFEALWRARERFDPGTGVPFVNFAATCILNAMRDECRKRTRRLRGLVPLADDAVYSEKEPGWVVEDFMRAVISDEDTIDILQLRYAEGRKLREIAVAKKMSMTMVYYRLTKGVELLREAAENQRVL